VIPAAFVPAGRFVVVAGVIRFGVAGPVSLIADRPAVRGPTAAG